LTVVYTVIWVLVLYLDMTCTVSVRGMLYSPTINIEPFLTKKEKKKNVEETYEVVL